MIIRRRVQELLAGGLATLIALFTLSLSPVSAASTAPSSTVGSTLHFNAATSTTVNSTIPKSDSRFTVIENQKYYPNGPDFDAYLPTTHNGLRPMLIMVHGGGWAGGDQSELAPWAREAAVNQGWDVFTVDYRLSATDPVAWADELHDVQAAVRYLYLYADRYQGDTSKIMMMGDSAGANLIALVSSIGTVNPVKGSAVGGGRDINVPIQAVALWSPPTELAPLYSPQTGQAPEACQDNKSCDYGWSLPFIINYIGCSPTQCPTSYAQASPITWVNPKTDPTFISNSTDELIPMNQIQDYVAELNTSNVPNEFAIVQGNLHAYFYGYKVWPATVGFLASRIGPSTPPGSSHKVMIWAGIAATLAVLLLVIVLLRNRSRSRSRHASHRRH